MGYGITRIELDDGKVFFVDSSELETWRERSHDVTESVIDYDETGLGEAASELTADTFDTALPQTWVDEVVAKTGHWPYGFVWVYPGRSIFGLPLPITVAAHQHMASIREAGL